MATDTAATCSKSVTRKETNIWLIGQPIQEIVGRKLPSRGDVLRRLFFLIKKDKLDVKQASHIVWKEVKEFWSMAGIPTAMDYNVIPKVQKEYDNWRTLQRNKSRRSTIQIKHEEEFQDTLDDLFDIGHANALELITVADDRAFLLAQREKGRKGYMSGVDQQWAHQETRRLKQKQAFELAKRKDAEHRSLNTTVELASSSSSDPEVEQEEPMRKRAKAGKKNIITPDLASALDRTQVTDRKAVYVLSAAASSLGHDVHELAISRSTIRRSRITARDEIATLIRESFNPQVNLTVHWDGKILPDLTGQDNVDRLPVIVSGAGVSKLLGVPKLPSGTGEAMAKAVVDCLEDWGVKDRIRALSFDTTASNTGHKTGACTLIEQMIGKKLLYCACRHHVMEIVAEKVFSECNPHCSGPNIQIFQRFQRNWNYINQEHFQTAEGDVPDREQIIIFCQQCLTSAQQRDDYRELLELTVIYLGGSPSRGIRFQKPGALHRARWMSRVIYGIKICLFRSQFVMTKHEQRGMMRFATFTVSLYVRAWFMAPFPAAAPANDLHFLQHLMSYNDKIISGAAVKAFLRHLWYLSEVMVSLAFFDPDTSLSVKRQMIEALDKVGTENPAKRLEMKAASSDIGQKTVADFVTKTSLIFFDTLNLPTEFLAVDPQEWDTRSDYQTALLVVRALKVVNDSAERGVALMQSFNGILTKNEDQKQYLLQVVENHRCKFPNTSDVTRSAKADLDNQD